MNNKKPIRPSVFIATLSTIIIFISAPVFYILYSKRFVISTGVQRISEDAYFLLAILIPVILLYIIVLIINNERNKLSSTDALTGIGSFAKFAEAAKTFFQQNSQQQLMYVHFDIDNFKFLNEIFGFKVGDNLLKHVALSLKRNFSRDGIYARIESDKFALIFRALSENAAINRLEKLSKDISVFQSNLDKPYDITISYGLYKIDDKELSIRSIDDRARITMLNHKNIKENTYAFYNEKNKHDLEWQNDLENKMRFALRNDQFIVCLQPKYNMKTLTVSGAEALVRWQYQDTVLLNPKEFIPLFEKNGFISKLDIYVLERVCQKIREWLDKGYMVMPVSINISRRDFLVENFCETVLETINKYSIPINLIEIEVTESAFMRSIDLVIDCIIKLKSYGFSISLDDFGTGYASLNSINRLPIDIIKIDQSLLNCDVNNNINNCIFTSVLEMAKRLGIKTIAEGVETEGQFDFIKKTECDMVQGYFLAEPMRCDEFETMVLTPQSS